MNTRTVIIIALIVIALIITSIASYTGIGLPTEEDKVYIRQSAISNKRPVRGGGLRYGK